MATSKKKKKTTKKSSAKKTTAKKTVKKKATTKKTAKKKTAKKTTKKKVTVKKTPKKTPAKKKVTTKKKTVKKKKVVKKATASSKSKKTKKDVKPKTKDAPAKKAAAAKKVSVAKAKPARKVAKPAKEASTRPESAPVVKQPIPVTREGIRMVLKEELRILMMDLQESVAKGIALQSVMKSQPQIEKAPVEMEGLKEIQAAVGKLPAIHTELEEIRQGLANRQPVAATPIPEGAELDDGVEPLRRFLHEWLEAHTENLLVKLVTLRTQAFSKEADPKDLGEGIEYLLEQLGAIPFTPERMDYVDPLIHIVANEHHYADAPDGVILETLRPGFRSSRGSVLAKAQVVVNRKEAEGQRSEESGSAGY